MLKKLYIVKIFKIFYIFASPYTQPISLRLSFEPYIPLVKVLEYIKSKFFAICNMKMCFDD